MIDIFTPSPWQMTLGERAALEGMVSQLAPRLSIEIGTAQGGSLQRIATHSEAVHSFDLVEPSLPRELFPNVTFHTGDSHRLLPDKLAELAEADESVDFVLVDGDHSADGVQADLEDLLASPAIRRTLIVIHDTLNDIVREGVLRVDFASSEKVVHVDLDAVTGHLSRGGPFRHQLWGGLGIVIVDEAAPASWPDHDFHDAFAVFAVARDLLVADERRGGGGDDLPAVHARALAETPAPATDASGAEAELRGRLAEAEQRLASLERSLSWRITAPLRRAKRELHHRTRGA